MIMIAIICLVVAIVALYIGMFFVKNKNFRSALYVSAILVLVALGITCGAYAGSFGGHLIFLIISPLPLVLNVISLSEEDENAEKFSEESKEATEETENDSENAESQKTKNKKKANPTACLHGIAALLSCACVFLSAMYIGIESVYGILAGLSLGLAFGFLEMALKKQTSFSSLLNVVFFGVAAGVCLCSGICVILYSISLESILFLGGCLSLGIHFLCKVFAPQKKPMLQSFFLFLGFSLLLLSTIL